MASAGAGPFPAAATAAAAVAGAPAGSVFVKRAGDALARFVRVPVLVGDAVTDLAKRASLELDWHTSAAYVDLFLVPDGLVEVVQRNPAREADVLVDTNLCLATVLLAEAGIRDRSCLLARLSSPPAAAPGECARTRPAASFRARRAGGPEGLAGRARDSAGVFAGVLTLSALALSSYPSQAAAAAATRRLQPAVALRQLAASPRRRSARLFPRARRCWRHASSAFY